MPDTMSYMEEDSVQDLLEAALKRVDDDEVQYHIRQALQQLVVSDNTDT
mgnify:CR=1 FL=1